MPNYAVIILKSISAMRIDTVLIMEAGAHEPPKAAKERATSVPCKYKLFTYFRV